MQGGGQLRVYTDGQCQFCLWMQRRALRYDRHQRLDWRDFNLPEVAAETPFPRDELVRRMHVLTPDGQWHAGYFGWVAILSALLRWRWIASLASCWAFSWLGPKLYQLVANHRYRIPWFVLAWLGAPTPCPPEGCPLSGTEVAGEWLGSSVASHGNICSAAGFQLVGKCFAGVTRPLCGRHLNEQYSEYLSSSSSASNR